MYIKILHCEPFYCWCLIVNGRNSFTFYIILLTNIKKIEKINLYVIFKNGTHGNQNNNKYKTTKQSTNHRYQLSVFGFIQIWNIQTTSFDMLLYKE